VKQSDLIYYTFDNR
jgi:hypothetical protein